MTPTPYWTAAVRQVALATVLLLTIPWLASHWTSEVNWGWGDFAVAAALLFGAGMLHAWARQRAQGALQRMGAAVLVMAGLGLVWAELAVGLLD